MDRLKSIWKGMMYRCNKPESHQYNDYGGRGIKVCVEWRKFESFREWAMTNGYSDDLTLDRIEVNGNYCPENCRWANWNQQMNNRRSNINITIGTTTMTQSEWGNLLEISPSTIAHRLEQGQTEEEAVLTPQHNLPRRTVLCPVCNRKIANYSEEYVQKHLASCRVPKGNTHRGRPSSKKPKGRPKKFSE